MGGLSSAPQDDWLLAVVGGPFTARPSRPGNYAFARRDRRMVRRNWILRLFAVAAATVAVGSSSQAGLLPVSVTVTPEANNFRWTYSIVLPTDMKLQSGDYFTIYDFGGLVAGSQFLGPQNR